MQERGAVLPVSFRGQRAVGCVNLGGVPAIRFEERRSGHGRRVLRPENDLLRVNVLPERGGKIRGG